MKYFLFVLILLNIGCVNKKLTYENYINKKYDKAYREYKRLADKGFINAAYKISYMIYQNKISAHNNEEIYYGKKAYYAGYKKAAVFVADWYVKNKNCRKALQWYDKAGFEYLNINDFSEYINCIKTVQSFTKEMQYLKKLENYALKSQKIEILRVLGRFYSSDTYFYDPLKAERFLTIAYKKGDAQSGVILGVLYIKNNNKKGVLLLKNNIYKNPKAGYYLGKYLYSEMIEKEKSFNKNCITLYDNNVTKFYENKLKIYKFNNIYTINNIKKAYDISYSLGYLPAKYELIKLDLEDNTYENTRTSYSGFDLNETVDFLKNKKDIESQWLLADIYEKYLYLNSLTKAKKIYTKMIKYDKVKALWKLYKFEKNFQNKINKQYLNYLIKQKYEPALIENAYLKILTGIDIKKNETLLKTYAKRHYVTALNLLGNLLDKGVLHSNVKSIYYYKLACEKEKKPFYIPSEDFKFANKYMKNGNKNMAMGIYYYYAYLNNRKAQYEMALFYKNARFYKKMEKLLKKLNSEADDKGRFFYYISLLKGYIEGNYKQAIDYLLKSENPISYEVLGYAYANGYYVEFNPNKAEYYYKKAVENGDNNAIYGLIKLYNKLNIDGQYDNKIIKWYLKAVKMHLPDAKIKLAKFYYLKKEKFKALKVLKSIDNWEKNSKALYLYYLIEKRLPIVNINGKESDNGYLLYVKAVKNMKINPQQALYYIFRAMLCNTPKSPILAYEIMKRIDDVSIIRTIYIKAKKAPLCHTDQNFIP